MEGKIRIHRVLILRTGSVSYKEDPFLTDNHPRGRIDWPASEEKEPQEKAADMDVLVGWGGQHDPEDKHRCAFGSLVSFPCKESNGLEITGLLRRLGSLTAGRGSLRQDCGQHFKSSTKSRGLSSGGRVWVVPSEQQRQVEQKERFGHILCLQARKVTLYTSTPSRFINLKFTESPLDQASPGWMGGD